MVNELLLLVLLATGAIGQCGKAEPIDFAAGGTGGADGGAGGSETTTTSPSSTTTDGGGGSGGSGGGGGAGGTTTSTVEPGPVGASCIDDAGCASGVCHQLDKGMSGVCQGAQPIGAECETAADCESFRCKSLPPNDQGAIGQCTQTPCGTDEHCGSGGVCLHNDVVGGWWCHRGCVVDADCLEPFVCTVDGICGITITSQP